MNSSPNWIDVLVGRNVKSLRCYRGYTIAFLALKLDVAPEVLTAKEAGKQRFSAQDLFQICCLFKVKPQVFYKPELPTFH